MHAHLIAAPTTVLMPCIPCGVRYELIANFISTGIKTSSRLQWIQMSFKEHARACAGYDDPNCGIYSEDEEDFIGSDDEDEDREALIHDLPPWRAPLPSWPPNSSALRMRRFAGAQVSP